MKYRTYKRQKSGKFTAKLTLCAMALSTLFSQSAQAAQTTNTVSTTSCSAQGGTLVGGNILTDFDNGTFGTENGTADQSPTADPYPGQTTGGIFSHFYSFFYGAYGYVANPVNPRNTFQHPDITDPVYGATGRFFASDPNINTPIINFTALNVLANQNYQISFWAANSEPTGAPNDINLEIDGIVSLNTGPLLAVPSALEWKKYSFVFNSGNRTTILIALRSLETGPSGRDFYLDNVEMEFCSLSGSDISGTIYSDVDRDNIYQAAREAGLSSVGIALYDTRGDGDATNDIYVGTTDSGTDGLFEFINVPANPNYELRVASADPDLPASSLLGTASPLSVILGSSDSDDNDFGFDIPGPNLVISKTSTVYDDGSSSGFSIPSEDMEYTIEVTNTGGEGMDIDSVIVIDRLPDNLTFFNDDFDGIGTATNDPILFQQSGAGLDFNYVRDVRFSDAESPPATFGACNYTPAAGYDPSVTYICLNPKGTMAGPPAAANFALKFRTLIN